MRFSTVFLAALVVATTTAVPLHHAPPAPKVALVATKDKATNPATSPDAPAATPATPADDEPNMTPYVRQLVNGMWEGGVPNYEDPTLPFWKREFAAEGEAKAWAYTKTGAADEIKYEQADGADGDEDMMDQFQKESTSTNNSNNEKAEDHDDDKEKPIIDDKLAHTANKEYHTSYDHSLLHGEAGDGSGKKNTGQTSREDHGGMSDATKLAMAQAKKAAKNAAWTKSVSGRNQANGGNDRLSKKQRAKTQGAKDAADKRSQKLNKLGSGKHKMSTSTLNSKRG